jgi:hypothetical protein
MHSSASDGRRTTSRRVPIPFYVLKESENVDHILEWADAELKIIEFEEPWCGRSLPPDHLQVTLVPRFHFSRMKNCVLIIVSDSSRSRRVPAIRLINLTTMPDGQFTGNTFSSPKCQANNSPATHSVHNIQKIQVRSPPGATRLESSSNLHSLFGVAQRPSSLSELFWHVEPFHSMSTQIGRHRHDYPTIHVTESLSQGAIKRSSHSDSLPKQKASRFSRVAFNVMGPGNVKRIPDQQSYPIINHLSLASPAKAPNPLALQKSSPTGCFTKSARSRFACLNCRSRPL